MKISLRYADRLHLVSLTLQCQKEGSMGSGRYRPAAFGERNQPSAKGSNLSNGSESSKLPQVSEGDKFAWIMLNASRLPEKESLCFRQHWGVAMRLLQEAGAP